MAGHGLFKCTMAKNVTNLANYDMLQLLPGYIAKPIALTCGIQFCHAAWSQLSLI